MRWTYQDKVPDDTAEGNPPSPRSGRLSGRPLGLTVDEDPRFAYLASQGAGRLKAGSAAAVDRHGRVLPLPEGALASASMPWQRPGLRLTPLPEPSPALRRTSANQSLARAGFLENQPAAPVPGPAPELGGRRNDPDDRPPPMPAGVPRGPRDLIEVRPLPPPGAPDLPSDAPRQLPTNPQCDPMVPSPLMMSEELARALGAKLEEQRRKHGYLEDPRLDMFLSDAKRQGRQRHRAEYNALKNFLEDYHAGRDSNMEAWLKEHPAMTPQDYLKGWNGRCITTPAPPADELNPFPQEDPAGDWRSRSRIT